MNQRPLNEQETKWQGDLRELVANYKAKLAKPDGQMFKGGSFILLHKLSLELQALKEDFSTRIIGKKQILYYIF